MKKIALRAITKKFNAGWLVLPATPEDKVVLDTFCEGVAGRYLTVSLGLQRGNKTFDQVKTVWALISILYEVQYGVKPNKDQAEQMYASLIEDYAETEEDLRHPGNQIPITLSRMDVGQADRFIQAIIGEIFGYVDFDPEVQGNTMVAVQEIFQQFEHHKGIIEKDPNDYNIKGELLGVDEWVARHQYSMASGRTTELEIAHIIPKGSSPQYRNCVWNFLRLTHYEHIEIQHRHGWSELLKIYPHLTGRVKRAYELGKKIDRLNNIYTDYGDIEAYLMDSEKSDTV